ncbi:MAG: leucine-rich repeat protein, partial [Muribaculaceae bacterium]|nr:leucine-rich repeat protein [Muribaculaceae bacterium]
KLAGVTFSPRLQSIGERAFYNTALTRVEIPDQVNALPTGVFYSSRLRSARIGRSVASIATDALNGPAFEHYEVDEANRRYSIRDGMLFSASGKTLISHPCAMSYSNEELEGIDTIADCAYKGCNPASTLIIPASVTMVHENAFDGWRNLVELRIADAKTPLKFNPGFNAANVFYVGRDVTTQKSVLQPGNMNILKTVKKLVIGPNVNQVRANMWVTQTTAYDTIEVHNMTPPATSPFSDQQYVDTDLLVPEGSKEAYEAHTTWKKFWVIKEVQFSALTGVEATKKVRRVRYYNVAGVASDEAFDGLNIVVTTYTDGTSTTTKMLK